MRHLRSRLCVPSGSAAYVEVLRNAAGEVVSTTALAEQPEASEPSTPTHQRLLDLPTDPSAPYVQITRDATQPQETLDLVGFLLAHSIAPPDVRAALFLAAKRIPGRGVLPDADGHQRGVVLGVTGPDIRSELSIDTGTGMLVSRRQVTVVDGAFKGAPAGTNIFDERLTARFVRTIGQDRLTHALSTSNVRATGKRNASGVHDDIVTTTRWRARPPGRDAALPKRRRGCGTPHRALPAQPRRRQRHCPLRSRVLGRRHRHRRERMRPTCGLAARSGTARPRHSRPAILTAPCALTPWPDGARTGSYVGGCP